MQRSSDIAHQRLNNLRLSGPGLKTPDEVVRWLVAVQSQDYAGAKWALGLRSQGCTDADVEQAFTDGAILRTHVMRPTWHFVAPADIRWLLQLTAPRVNMLNATYTRKAGLDAAILRKSNATIEKTLAGGKCLTRTELGEALQQAGIPTDGFQGLAYLMMHAELTGLICSGGRRGKQFTYALLEERVPPAPAMSRDEALSEFAVRYFTSRGPATVHDFAKWSGLTITDGKRGVEIAGRRLVEEVIDGKTYWLSPSRADTRSVDRVVYLLPNYDEYLSSYADHNASFDDRFTPMLDTRGNVVFAHFVVLDGQVLGTWKRTVKKIAVSIETNLFIDFNAAERAMLTMAAKRYGEFLGLPMEMT